MKIVPRFFIAIAAFLFLPLQHAAAQKNGETIFKETCAACHSIGKGKLVGPDLANILERRPEAWILKFVKSSQTVVKSGDKYADSLFQAFNKVVMPDHPSLSDVQIKDVISYIEASSSGAATVTVAATPGPAGQKAGKNADSIFTTINLFMFSVTIIMLIVILFLAKTNKNLLDQIRDYYSSDRSIF